MVEALRSPVQARAQRTRAALLEAAVAEFDACGYAGTTAKSIAARAGVATGSFYQYFTDKDAVLRELARTRSERLADSLGASGTGGAADTGEPGRSELHAARARRVLTGMIRRVLAYHRQETGLHAVLTERRHADAALDAITAEAERGLMRRIEADLRRWGAGGDVRALSFVIFSMVEGAVHTHVLGAREVSDRRLVAALGDAVVALAASRIAGAHGMTRDNGDNGNSGDTRATLAAREGNA